MGLRSRGAEGRRRRLVDRLFHSRVRTWLLVLLTVVLTAVAVRIGLPPQSDLPSGFGRIVAVPVLPHSKDGRPYTVRISWNALNFERTSALLLTDTFWTEAGSYESPPGLPVYLAVGDSGSTDLLLACANGVEGTPRLTEVQALPPTQQTLLDAYLRDEHGGTSSSVRYLRVDDRSRADDTDAPFASCLVPTERIFTRDDVELHLRAPGLVVVAPPETAARAKDEMRPYLQISLPAGWAPQDARTAQGERKEVDQGIRWVAAAPDDSLSGRPRSTEYRALEVGPVTLEATSLNAARSADRKLFWSGLLVGLAGSCLLMLFESLPWRREERKVS